MNNRINRFRMKEPRLKIKKSWLYFFCFCAIILCVVNTVFLIKNWQNLEIRLDDTSNIILTIIGVLFAFTAINIYSLFNTNIDAEKERVDVLADEYDNLLNVVNLQYPLSTNIVRFQMVIHSLSASEAINSQFLDWVQKATELAKEFIPSLDGIRRSKMLDSEAVFKEFLFDINIVVRDANYLMSEKAKVVSKDSFYGSDTGLKKDVISSVNDLIQALKDFEDHEFFPQNQAIYPDKKEPVSILDGIKSYLRKGYNSFKR